MNSKYNTQLSVLDLWKMGEKHNGTGNQGPAPTSFRFFCGVCAEHKVAYENELCAVCKARIEQDKIDKRGG